MEYVVHQFAKKLKIPFDPNDDTWGVILGRVHDKIDSWGKGAPNYKNKKKYKACYRLMDGMRPWRNDLMHHKVNYSEERVQDLMGNVKSCVNEFLRLPNLIL